MIWKCGPRELDLSVRGVVMGILNVTPDSFSDGGRWAEVSDAVERALAMAAEGAEIIDIGGESTRPGSESVSEEEELRRVIPVIEELSRRWEGVISVDTSKAEVARQALAAGATVVNDVQGFRDGAMREVCAESDCGLVVMHMQGRPRTMQDSPSYDDVVAEVSRFFEDKRVELAAEGILGERIAWDPGIGFGKRLEDNLSLLRATEALSVAGRPLVLGVSKKSLFAQLLGEGEMEARVWPTVGVTAWTRAEGVRVHRVHDVKANVDALRMAEAILAIEED